MEGAAARSIRQCRRTPVRHGLSLVAIITLFWFTTDGVVLSSVNLINVVSQYSYILILAIGMVMVIIAGH